MKRLTERFSNGQAGVLGCGENCAYKFKYCEDFGRCPTMNEILDTLATYEEADEKGLIVIKTEAG